MKRQKQKPSNIVPNGITKDKLLKLLDKASHPIKKSEKGKSET